MSEVPPGYHMEALGDSKFVISLRYSNLKLVGSGAQGYVVRSGRKFESYLFSLIYRIHDLCSVTTGN
ncbi:hypothetical protein AHF37_05809 [Paragonimus kellicotti]|nr:hypothetical protein AHF37_05809 [Paragonimus kellicotti]